MKRLDRDFISHGQKCAAWLFRPEGVEKPPVVVMAHGLAAERTFRLPAFAERFCAKGLAALVFDYRNFGDSAGKPRNLISPRRHVQDWLAAISHARSLHEVDGTRIGLWGSSFSGGHVLVAAARDGRVSAVVSQVPFVDGVSTALSMNLRSSISGMIHALRDLLSVIAFQGPHCVPVAADPGEFALMNTPESKPGYLALVPPESNWKNQAPARIILTLPFYRPIAFAKKIQCPVLMIYAENDSLIPARDAPRCAAEIRQVQTVKLAGGHFDLYVGELFEKVSAGEAEFLCQYLIRAG